MSIIKSILGFFGSLGGYAVVKNRDRYNAAWQDGVHAVNLAIYGVQSDAELADLYAEPTADVVVLASLREHRLHELEWMYRSVALSVQAHNNYRTTANRRRRFPVHINKDGTVNKTTNVDGDEFIGHNYTKNAGSECWVEKAAYLKDPTIYIEYRASEYKFPEEFARSERPLKLYARIIGTGITGKARGKSIATESRTMSVPGLNEAYGPALAKSFNMIADRALAVTTVANAYEHDPMVSRTRRGGRVDLQWEYDLLEAGKDAVGVNLIEKYPDAHFGHKFTPDADYEAFETVLMHKFFDNSECYAIREGLLDDLL